MALYKFDKDSSEIMHIYRKAFKQKKEQDAEIFTIDLKKLLDCNELLNFGLDDYFA